MSANNSTKALFSPIKVGKVNLQHRVVMAPLTRIRASADAVPADISAEYYGQRASDGGLLITEGTFVSPTGANYANVPGVYNQKQIDAWKKITAAVHEKKGAIFVQLWHLGRAGVSSTNPNNEPVVSASAIPINGNQVLTTGGYEVPHALTIDEIKNIIQEYRQAAVNAIEAGFDGVELHGANGYLIDQFINSNSNKRTDIYGGSTINRLRFPLELLESVSEAIGADRVAIRFSPGGSFQDMGDDNVVDTWSLLTSEIQKRLPSLAYLHFIEPRANFFNDSVNTDDTLAVFRQLWKGPFIVASGFSTARDHAIEIAEKTGSLVAFGRAFIANPDLPERLRNNWELNKYDRNTFYTSGPAGYTDYPFYNESKK